MHPRQQLCTSFALQAAHTWSFLARGDRYKLLPGEETITDVNLLGLKEAKPSLVYTDKYTRYREGKVTGDWEWWIADSRGWLGLRIQAKKLDPQTGRYLDLEGDVQKATAQADRLVHDALVGSDRRRTLLLARPCSSYSDQEIPASPS